LGGLFDDNVLLLGLAKDVLAAQHDLEAQLCRDLGATPNHKESYFYAPAWTADQQSSGFRQDDGTKSYGDRFPWKVA